MNKTIYFNRHEGQYPQFSNFFPCLIKWKGRIYSCSEAIFYAESCKYPEDAEKFVSLTGKQAKELGKTVEQKDDWNDIKVLVMYKIVFEKFKQNPYLRTILLSTGNSTLIEKTMWHDNFWGNCACHKCSDITGQNTLGKILMRVRKELSKPNTPNRV